MDGNRHRTAAPPCRRTLRAGSLRRDESGQSVVEFAMVVPLICAIVLILVDFGKAMNYWLDLTQVANEGARIAAVNGPVTPDSIRARLKTVELRNGGGTSITAPTDVAICYTSAQVGEPVTVQLTSSYHWVSFPSWMPIVGGGLMTIKARATMRLEQTPTYATAGSCT
jgi:Flp pilus assembly protein TadG